MPVKRCRKGNKPGFKCGDNGTCYTYTEGNDSEKEQARSKAAKQCQAIHVNKKD